MKLSSLRGTRLDYPAALAMIALGLVPGIWCVRSVHKDELAKVERGRHYRPPSEKRREVHFYGVAQAVPEAPSGPSAPPGPSAPSRSSAPSGRPCLAWGYEVYERATHPANAPSQRVCSLRGDVPFQIVGTDASRFWSIPGALTPTVHAKKTRSPGNIAGCPERDLSRTQGVAPTIDATAYEYCLQPGDGVDVWACREGDRLVPCGDGLDRIATPSRLFRPEDEAMDGTGKLCCGSSWFVFCLLMLIGLLDGRLTMRQPLARPAGKEAS